MNTVNRHLRLCPQVEATSFMVSEGRKENDKKRKEKTAFVRLSEIIVTRDYGIEQNYLCL